MPFDDTGTLPDPFIRGIDHLGQIVVAQYLFRQVAAGTNNAGIGHALAFLSS